MPLKNPARTPKEKANRGDCVPGKLTAEVRADFLRYYASGFSAYVAARKVGVTRTAIFELRRRDAEFAKKYEAAREASLDAMEDNMQDMANNGNLTAMFGILRAFRPGRWRENVKVEHSGTVDIPASFAQAMEQMQSAAGKAQAH